MEKGTLFVVATPIGNLEDITLRALRILRSVHLIAAEDTRRTRQLVEAYGIKTPLVSLHEHNERKKAQDLISRIEEGADIAYVTDAGTPGISDPGYLLIQEALKAKISIVPIPGPSAVITALVVSGLPADSFLFLAFLPARVSERRKILTSLVEERRTIVLFESPHRLEATINDIYEILGDRPMVLARELTKVHEEVIRGTTGEIREKLKGRHLKGEITLVIGGVRETKSVSDEEIINALLRLKGEEGMTDRDRITQVAREKGISRRRVYLLDLKLRKSHPFS